MKYRVITLILGLVLIASACNAPKTSKIEPTEAIVSGEQVSPPATQTSQIEPKSETKSEPTKSAPLGVADLVIPAPEEEQQAQIDQNTIKNVEQDNKITEIDNRVTEVENKVVNLPPAYVPPAPEPVVEPEPIVVPDPVCEDQTATNFGGSLPCTFPPPPPTPEIRCVVVPYGGIFNNQLTCKNTFDTVATITSITFDGLGQIRTNPNLFSMEKGDTSASVNLTIPVTPDYRRMLTWGDTDRSESPDYSSKAKSITVEINGETKVLQVTY